MAHVIRCLPAATPFVMVSCSTPAVSSRNDEFEDGTPLNKSVDKIPQATGAFADEEFAKRSDERVSGRPKPPLTIAIAVPARGSRNDPESRVIDLVMEESHFNVVITNTSDRPQRLFETSNSWGFRNLRFEVVDPDNGKLLFEITKIDRTWRANAPASFKLAPGEHFVMDVHFDRDWNLPFLNEARRGNFRFRMPVVYENSSNENGEWTGKIVSPFKNYEVNYRQTENGYQIRRLPADWRLPRR